MWPWEHAAFGYLLLSLGVHAWRRAAPADQPTVLLLVGTQLPDLVDKPLSWWLGLFPSGFSVTHSVFVMLPAVAAVAVVTWHRHRPELGVAFGIGYASHLAGDVVSPLRSGDGLGVSRVLWPLVRQPAYDHDYGLLRRTASYFTDFGSTLATGGLDVAALYLTLPAAALLLWFADGRPGLAPWRR